MEAHPATPLVQLLRRFARWFFTCSPVPVADPLDTLKPMRRTEHGGRRPRGLRAQHAGRVGISQRKRS